MSTMFLKKLLFNKKFHPKSINSYRTRVKHFIFDRECLCVCVCLYQQICIYRDLLVSYLNNLRENKNRSFVV